MKHTRHPRPSVAEAIEATAAAWLAQRDDGFTPEQAAEFLRWRSADVRHETAAARLEATWSALQRLREFRPEAARHPDRDLLRVVRGRRRVGSFPAIAATVALAASLVLAAVWWFTPAERQVEPGKHSYTTTLDGYERVALADGSTVELNSASEVRVQFSPAERRVRLVRGEAHFTVAKNPARPFWVEAGSVAVRAVGTAFNVRLGAQDIEVLVTEGKVLVAQDRSSRGDEAGTSRASPNDVTLTARPRLTPLEANERVVIPVARVSITAVTSVPPAIEQVTPEAVREALAWQGPRLVFVDTLLADAIAQFNRRNPVQIELADAELGALPIGGSFRAENVDAFVRLLASGGEVAVERPSSTRIVLRKIGPRTRRD
jgi:transmembrane sensor